MTAALKLKLTPEQFYVTQQCGTEPPFQNEYWDNHEDGVYVDIVSGEPLFSSLDKYDSGTGWPSFTRPVDRGHVTFQRDASHGRIRTEVRSAAADSHLGHVFDDGPGVDHKRYCINSAALRFVPLDRLKEEGLGHFLFQFANKREWEIATVAGGCFWGLEELLLQQPGVIETQVGYTGGRTDHPRYEQVHRGETGHAEAVQVLFDPKQTSYEQLLLTFFKLHDPTSLNRQGNDVGTSYRSGIFPNSDAQRKVAERVLQRVEGSGKWRKPIVTEIIDAGPFWRAEDYHQKYLLKNPGGYTCHYERNIEF